ncbi:CBS domain-containing protein [Rossellomorea sp. SC111]|uniref:cyclic-di-AMP-binding protein CbpB n=1 Tax=Rossellomorea sp. SC111 TaxID=2968985 RepID=UPI00215A4CDF|nr:cyclic-di-AMP-binding protein CbpB [Rossellomorea sp. SC111]MCR8849186.1 CBS domain-containing protein [Rossellomorea sp. SC111]
MISLSSKELLETNIKDFIIPSEKVAHVQMGNSLEHALLLLTKSGYSAIPVLDPAFRFQGLISSSLITDSILGLERFEFEKLEAKKVEEVMTTDFPIISLQADFKKALELLVDHPFLCVVSDDGYFEGIMTRRVVLKQLQRQLFKRD